MSEHDLYARALDLIKEEAAQKKAESAQHAPQQAKERHSSAYSDGSRSVAEFMGDDESV